jgi:exopolysaccharide biosynthesis WecB/TagA/CpsF family protein
MSATRTLIRTARRAARPLTRSVRQRVLPYVLPAAAHDFPPAAKHIKIVGLLSSSSGLGESARLCARALAQSGYQISGGNVAGLYASDDGIAFPGTSDDAPADVVIYHLNPPMLLPSILRTGLRRHAGTYKIGYWAWELETLPDEWVRALRFVDAVMVPSRFCQEAVRRHTDKPVLVVPHPVDAAGSAPARGPSGRFRVLSIFNFGSSYRRKNPEAVVQAFRTAFGDDLEAELILKVSDGARFPAERAQILAKIQGLPNVRLIDEVWDREALQALIASADVYLSLHRSEGFGLTLAEAALGGVPLVATNWSGNTDFCVPELSYPVDYRLVPFHDSDPSYSTVGTARWAEPSVAHAAEQLCRVRGDGEAARVKADALRTAVSEYLSQHSYREAIAGLVRPQAVREQSSGRTAGSRVSTAIREPAARVSLIVCTLGRLAPLERLLASLRTQTQAPFEILVVDQNPAEYLQALLDRYRDLPIVHLVDLANERGLSRGRNLGLRIARGEIVGFPDDDCWYDPVVIEKVVQRFDGEDGLTLLTGRTVDAEGQDSVSRHLPSSGTITRTNVFLAGNSNGLFVRRAAVRRAEGFDENLGVGAGTPFQSGEESDFILRHLAEGGNGWFAHDLVVRHDSTEADAAVLVDRARRYAPGFGRVLRLHGFPPSAVAGRLSRASLRGTLLILGGKRDAARQSFAWAAGTARGYLAARAAPELRRVFGLSFSSFGEGQLAASIVGASVPAGSGPRMVATANVDHIVQLSRNAAFRQAYKRAWVVTADGMPVYLYAKLRGSALPCRLTGADLFARVMTSLSAERHRCFFVATTPEIARLLEADLMARGFPADSLAFAVPPFGFERDDTYSADLAQRVRAHGATHLFIGVGAPKAEIWIDRYRDMLSDCYVLPVGAALEFYVGAKRRAPVVLQKAGFEWAWRVATEPRRLFRRYFVESWRFLWLVGVDLARPGAPMRDRPSVEARDA